MEFKEFTYDAGMVCINGTKENMEFSNNTRDSNIIYFFYKGDKCLYIGESSCSLYERCFRNSPKHKDKKFFTECNRIKIIALDNSIDIFGRQALEAIFIMAFLRAGHPLQNKKG